MNVWQFTEVKKRGEKYDNKFRHFTPGHDFGIF